MSFDPGRFIALNWLELSGASIAATSEVGERTADNLADPDPDLTWRSTDTSDQVLTCTLDQRRAVDGIGLVGHNLTVAAEVTVDYRRDGASVETITVDAHRPLYGAYSHPGAYLFGAYGMPDQDDSVEVLWPYTDIWRDNIITADELRITISDSANPDGYIEATYLTVGHSFWPGKNYAWGYECGLVNNQELEITPAGTTHAELGDPVRACRARWEWLTTAELTRINQLLLQARARSGAVFWSGYPGRGGAMEQQHVMLGYPARWTAPAEPSPAQGTFELELQEIFFHE